MGSLRRVGCLSRIDPLGALYEIKDFSLWLKHFRSTYARSLDEQSPWLLQRRNACCMPLFGFAQSSLSSLGQPKRVQKNRKRAPSGPAKVVVTNQPHTQRHTGVDLVSGTSALLAWFPASWASKIAPCFLGEAGGATQAPQEVSLSPSSI